jgi:hypothetical protein
VVPVDLPVGRVWFAATVTTPGVQMPPFSPASFDVARGPEAAGNPMRVVSC